jgi:hypothetical protein
MNSYIVYDKNVNFEKRSTFTWDYGSLDVRANPLHRGTNMHMVNEGVLLDLGLDDVKQTPAATDIPLGSNFGQVSFHYTSFYWVCLYGEESSANADPHSNLLDDSKAYLSRYIVRQCHALVFLHCTCTIGQTLLTNSYGHIKL